jgi:hypothetical protein
MTGATEYKTPFELYWRRKPSLKHAVTFGAPCRILLLGEQRPHGKFTTHTLRGHVLGRGEDGVQILKEYRYLLGWIVLTEDGRILQSRHVNMDERYAVRPTIEGGKEPTPYPWQGPLPDDTDAELDAAADVPDAELDGAADDHGGVNDPGQQQDYTAAELDSAADDAVATLAPQLEPIAWNESIEQQSYMPQAEAAAAPPPSRRPQHAAAALMRAGPQPPQLESIARSESIEQAAPQVPLPSNRGSPYRPPSKPGYNKVTVAEGVRERAGPGRRTRRSFEQAGRRAKPQEEQAQQRRL